MEIALWVVLAISILLVLSNFGVGGKAGGAVASFFFGCFGIMSWLFPVLLFVGTAFGMANRNVPAGKRKLISVLVLYILLCAFFQLLTNHSEEVSPAAAFTAGFTEHTGGGFFGGIFEALLRPNIGTAGAYVVVIIGMIICIVLLTERSFFRGMKNKGTKIAAAAREEVGNRIELSRERRREMRMDKKARGVSTNTTLRMEKQEEELSEELFVEEPEPLKDHTKDMDVVERSVYQVKPGDAEISVGELVIRNANAPAQEAELPLSYESEEETLQPEPAKAAAVGEEPLTFAEEPSEAVEEALHEEEQLLPPKAEAVEPQKPVEPAPTPEKKAVPMRHRKYVFPDPRKLLTAGDRNQSGDGEAHLRETAAKLQQTLSSFGVNATVTNATCGPTVTRYELQPEIGVKVSKIVGLADDIKLNLAAADIRIEAPIPGKSVIGIEVPNQKSVPVMFRDVVLSPSMSRDKMKSDIAFGVGKDIGGEVVVSDIAKMPHVLIAGATGSGKSVCINTIIMSILYRADPENVKMIMIDPKVVELSVYNGIPHLLKNVVTDPHEATQALNWAVAEMDRRYQLFAKYNVRDLKGYNGRVEEVLSSPDSKEIPEEELPVKLPQIIVIVDELADLMMVASGDVEGAICRLAQLARACGIHLVIATQRPSVNVITGLIKANMPSRIAFAVTSGVDSRTILDMVGAEKLLGKGDMLYFPQGIPKPIRVQGAFVSDEEVRRTVEFIVEHNAGFAPDPSVEEAIKAAPSVRSGSGSGFSMQGADSDANEKDAYFAESAKLIIDKEKASIGMLQRAFKIGFNRAARIMDQLEEAGVVGPEAGTKPREILMNEEQLAALLEE